MLETVGDLLGKLTWLPDEGVGVGARSRTTTNTAHYQASRNGVPQEVDMVRSSRGTATPDISR